MGSFRKTLAYQTAFDGGLCKSDCDVGDKCLDSRCVCYLVEQFSDVLGLGSENKKKMK